jgi:aldose sugar dehydrogenase
VICGSKTNNFITFAQNQKQNMSKYILSFFALAALAMCHTPSAESTSTTKGASHAEATFKQYCTGCHGADANVFADRKWKHGSTKADLIKSIANGYPDLTMPKWEGILKPQDIEELSDYILAGIEKRKSFDFKSTPKSPLFTEGSIKIRLDTIATGIKSPWGMTSLPDGDMVFTEKGGDIFRIGKTGEKAKIAGGPTVLSDGQGGLMDVELHPKFQENKIIYFTYSKVKDSAAGKWSTTAVMRAKLDGLQLSEQTDIFVALPYHDKSRYHYGSRLEFDRNGYLYVSVGDRGQHESNLPQLLDNDCGKIHRIMDDGRIPSDNPFANKPNARGSIWSYGHRNPQGISLNPTTGELWEDEHGPRGGDEVNIPKKGKNYGWPAISYGINYDGKILTPFTKKDNMEQPLTYWVPSIGPCGQTFVTGDRYKAWKGDLMVASLRFMYLNRCKISGDKIVLQENLLKNIGRMRFVEMGRDGYLYVGVEDPGFIFRLMPLEVK